MTTGSGPNSGKPWAVHSSVERRIFGLENEYGVTCTLRGQRRLSPDEVARYLFRRVVSWGRSSNVFLENGARLYLDVGSHPEYATPECDSIYDVVVHDKAGERILESLLMSAEQRLREEGIRGEVYLFKNNTDSAGNSYGCHENYLVEREGDFARFTDVLIPFLVSRQIFAGAGKVLQTARGAMYCVSQRAEHIWEGVSSATTRSRPIINTRDEPHADAERFRRLHVIVGDSNMSEYTNFLKMGTASIVLRMLEEDKGVWRDLTLENPIRAIREISHDITCKRQGAPGQRPGAVGLRDPVGVPDPGPEVRRPEGPRRAGGPGAGHVGARHGRPRDRPAVAPQRDRLGHQVPPDRAVPGAAQHPADAPQGGPGRPRLPRREHASGRCSTCWSARGWPSGSATDADILDATTNPPQSTRAKLRGAFIKRAKERKRDYTVDWVHLKLNDQAQRTVLCKDPFKSEDERVEKLIACL